METQLLKKIPSTHLEAIKYLSDLQKQGIEIPTNGMVEWRLLSYATIIKIAQKLWNERNAASK